MWVAEIGCLPQDAHIPYHSCSLQHGNSTGTSRELGVPSNIVFYQHRLLHGTLKATMRRADKVLLLLHLHISASVVALSPPCRIQGRVRADTGKSFLL